MKLGQAIKIINNDEIDIVYLKHEKATLSKMGEKFLDNLVKEVTFDN